MKLFNVVALALVFALVGCSTSRDTGLLVFDTSASGDMVVQVDSVAAEIIGDGKKVIRVPAGEHRVRITNKATVVMDSVVQVSGEGGNAMFAATMASGAFSAGLVAVTWPTSVVIVPFVFIIPYVFIKEKPALLVNGTGNVAQPSTLYTFGENYFQFESFRKNMGMKYEGGRTLMAQTKGACFDKSTGALWFQSTEDSNIYAVNSSKVKMCMVSETTMNMYGENQNSYECNYISNDLLEKIPCKY